MISAEQAALELLKRREARVNFNKFCEYVSPDEPPDRHHQLLNDTLDEVIDGIVKDLPTKDRLRRVMVFMPPGSAKSTYGSVRFPAYFLGRLPNKGIISASYSDDLSKNFGRKVRNLLAEESYRLLFDTSLSADAKAKGEWETNDGGHYFACGVDTGVTGRRADLALIDDPVKGRKEADSPTVRNSTWEWYRSDLYSRLKPNAAQIIIQTRWHEDDLSGRILPPEWNGESGDFVGFDGQVWRVICLPAEARENDILGRRPGEWLWTNFFTPETWEEIKSVQTSKDTRNWSSLYQQVPRPEDGTFFKREWFKRYPLGTHPPLTLYGATDAAVTDEKDGAKDATEHGVGGFDAHDNLYFVDWWSGRTTMDVWIDSQINLAKRYDPMVWVMEGGIIRRAVEPFLKKAKQKRHYYRSEFITSNSDKAANCRAFQALASMGQVYIPECQWGDDLIDQLVKFIPNTNFLDDKVDVCGLFGRILDQTFAPTEAPVEEKPNKDSYDWDGEEEVTWKTA